MENAKVAVCKLSIFTRTLRPQLSKNYLHNSISIQTTIFHLFISIS